MKSLWVVLYLCVGMLIGSVSASATCSQNLDKILSSHQKAFACDAASADMKFCSSGGSGCYRVDFKRAEKRLKSQIKKQSGYANRKALRYLQRSSVEKKGVLLGYLDLMNWKKRVRVKTDFLVQTGPYGKIFITDKPTSVRCLREIMHSAYMLESHFPEFTFQIDGDIRGCKNLKTGVLDLVKNKKRVKRNIAKIHSPMHTVYLTTTTKFNNFLVGKMGLYINVNRRNEIPNRLIEFRVGTNQIDHEARSL